MLSAYAFEEQFAKDPSWEEAFNVALSVMPVPDHVGNMLRMAWSGVASPEEIVRVIGFSDLNPMCLLDASGHNHAIPAHSRQELEQSIQFLGVQFTSVVLAVNLVGRSVLKKNPPASWVRLFESSMESIEIGYLFGQRSSVLGSAGGSIAGFARHIGLLFLMVARPKKYVKYLMLLKGKEEPSPEDFRSIFHCEPWQVSALAMQQLGFGSDLAFGASLAGTRVPLVHVELSERQQVWKAAALWIEALKQGRNFPADVRYRSIFPELTPPKQGARNQNLEALYTEVSKIRGKTPKWTWHLPKPSYEQTKALL